MRGANGAAPILPVHPEVLPGRPQLRIWYVIAGAMLVAIAAGTAFWPRFEHRKEPGLANAALSLKPGYAATGQGVRILCGYQGLPHIGRVGDVWGPDSFFTGGGPWPTRRGYIRRANDPFLLQNTRTGQFSYDIPAHPGIYELHLYFLEAEYGEELGGGENTRTMQIQLNGATLFQSFDPLSDAGGPRIADERVFKDVQPASDGKVHLSFASQRGQPMISAIALLPGIAHKQIPMRLFQGRRDAWRSQTED